MIRFWKYAKIHKRLTESTLTNRYWSYCAWHTEKFPGDPVPTYREWLTASGRRNPCPPRTHDQQETT